MQNRAPTEKILEPELPIVDPHHHLWDWPPALLACLPAAVAEHGFSKVLAGSMRYLLPEFLADLNTGHDIRATVFVQCGTMYRADGPEEFKPIGETEFVNGVAAMSASGNYGPIRACAGIVGHADLTAGAAVSRVLEAHLRTAADRFRGIRHTASYDADANVLGPLVRVGPGLYAQKNFREGYAQLAKYRLSFDAWLLEPQLPELIDLARSFPQTTGRSRSRRHTAGAGGLSGPARGTLSSVARQHSWLAALPNVCVKLGGLAMSFCNFPSFLKSPPASSAQLAAEWRPYIETCIEAFGVNRCMFESSFPVDMGSCTAIRFSGMPSK